MLTKLISSLPPSLRDNIRGIKRFSLFNKKKPRKQLLIYFADGTTFHGGLTDRFKGMISLFAFCYLNGIEFRIEHSSPFRLTNFLVPNTYNWIFRDGEKISYNLFESKYIFLIGEPSAKRLINLHTSKQIHCLANRDIVENIQKNNTYQVGWGELYKKLFKPTPLLQKKINYFKSKIGEEYISLVFRFQNLLGDFDEYNKPELPQNEKEILITKCKNEIKRIQSFTTNRILITSDSQLFLESLTSEDQLFSFPEKVVHIDNSTKETNAVYMKSLVDFYLLIDSKKIYSIGTKEMYKSEFPEYAAKVNNISFQRILIE